MENEWNEWMNGICLNLDGFHKYLPLSKVTVAQDLADFIYLTSLKNGPGLSQKASKRKNWFLLIAAYSPYAYIASTID